MDAFTGSAEYPLGASAFYEGTQISVYVPKGRQDLLRTTSHYTMSQFQQDVAECVVLFVNGERLPAKCAGFGFSMERYEATVQIAPSK